MTVDFVQVRWKYKPKASQSRAMKQIQTLVEKDFTLVLRSGLHDEDVIMTKNYLQRSEI